MFQFNFLSEVVKKNKVRAINGKITLALLT